MLLVDPVLVQSTMDPVRRTFEHVPGLSKDRGMSDDYTWNNPGSLARMSIEYFLGTASARVEGHPERLPCDPKQAQLIIAWLRALLDRKPSELA